MSKITTLILSVFLVYSNCLKAEQLLGINISYKNIGSNKFEVTYKVHTEKFIRGKFDSTMFKPLIFKVHSGNASVAHSPKLLKTDSINLGCPTNKKISYIYFYSDTVDLNRSVYSSIRASGNCRTYFTCKYPERYRGLKNIAVSAYFTYAFINTCNSADNSSPQTGSDPFKISCCNQPFYKSNSPYDTANFDSLSHALANPFKDFNSKILFSSGYSLREQLDVYWPTAYNKSFGPMPTTNPPIGMYFDSLSDELIFTPILCNSDYSIITETIDHKKLSGLYKEVGGFLNDFVINVNECKENYSPILNGPYKYEGEAGNQICFTITSDDKTFIPPPPAKPLPLDTVRLTWNRGIPGASFTIVNPNERLQRGKFCWTPKLNQDSDLPYIFTVTARDNACPMNAFTGRTYSVKVNKSTSISIPNPHRIVISPNPSKGELNIRSEIFKFNEVGLFNITGKQLMQWQFEETSEFKMHLNQLASGIYFIKCTNGSEVFNFKWIRE